MASTNSSTRPPAYKNGQYVWRFRDIPLTITHKGKQIPNPVREAAVFVVHGIGEQIHLDTAIVLRDGFEDVLDKPQCSRASIPSPFIYEGYWANYNDMKKTFPEEWNSFTPRERRLFAKMWRRRSSSASRTFGWFVVQMFRLVFDPKVFKKVGAGRWSSYLGVFAIGFITLIFLLIRHQRILKLVLGDVRIYIEPKGAIEEAIVQRIDRRVGEQFLLLLGLNWNFESLPPEEQLRICGQPHIFSRVTWVAHSLGSIISYNVISDIFSRYKELESTLKNPNSLLPEAYRKQLEQNISRVKKGIHQFITIGSPLEKITFLFPNVLRKWPEDCQERIARIVRSKRKLWWTNFFHIWDPVSGILKNQDYFQLANNLHSGLWRLPALAHVSYWKNEKILKYIVKNLYNQDVFSLPNIHFMNQRFNKLLLRFNRLFMYPILAAIPILIPYLVVRFRGQILGLVRQWLSSLIGS